MRSLSILFILLVLSQQILCQTVSCLKKESLQSNEEFLKDEFLHAAKILLNENQEANSEWQCLMQFISEKYETLQEAFLSIEELQDKSQFFILMRDIKSDNFEQLRLALNARIISEETALFIKEFINQATVSFGLQDKNYLQQVSLLQLKESDEDVITAESNEEVAETLADMTQAEADILDESESEDDLRGSELDDDEQSAIDGLLQMMNEALLLALDVNGDANDIFYDIEDYIADEWEEDTQEAGEDCARYGGDFADNIYYVILSLDIDEFDILISDNKKIIDDFKKGMDAYYEEWAEEEEDEDEEEYGEFYLLTQTKEDDDEESGNAEELMDLLVDAIDKIREVNSDANDVLYEASRLIENDWDDDYQVAAEDLFEEEFERTNYFYMELVRLDVDEIEFLTTSCKGVLDDLFLELKTIYEEEVGDDYEESFIQKKTKINKLQKPTLNFIHSQYNSSEKESRLADKDYDEFNSYDTDENEDAVTQYCNEVVLAILLTSKVNSTVNTLIEDYLIKGLEEYFEDDYEQATSDCYSNNEEQGDWMLVQLSELDMDEATFLTSDNIAFWADWQTGLMDYAEENFGDKYDDESELLLVQKKIKNKSKSKEEDETDSAQWLLESLEESVYRTTIGDETVNDLIQEMIDYIELEDTYDNDYVEAAEDIYDYDSTTTSAIYGWLARYDANELTFLSSDSIAFYDDMKAALDDVYEEEETQEDFTNTLTNVTEFLISLSAGLSGLYHGQIDGEAPIEACVEYYEDIWEEDAEALAEECYQDEYDLTSEVFSKFLRTDTDELNFLSDDSDQFLTDFWNALQDVYEDEADEYEMFIQKEKTMKVGSTVTEDFCTGWVQAMRHILNVDSEVNDLIEDLEDIVETYYDDDYQDAAYDCYSYDQTLTDWILLEYSLLDIDESSILIEDNEDFMNELAKELKELYKEEEADRYELLQRDSEENNLTLEYEFKFPEEEFDEAPYPTAEDDTDYYYAKKQRIEDFDSSDQVISDSSNLVQGIIEAIDRIEDGNSKVNKLVSVLEDYVEDMYEDDYEKACGDMYQLESESCDIIYAWIAHYDVDEITFLTDGSMQFFENIKSGFDSVYINIAPEPTQIELNSANSIEDFLETLIYALELCLVGDTECDSIVMQTRFYVDDKWDGDTQDAANDCYEVEQELTYDAYALFQIEDNDELLFLGDDNLDFLENFWADLRDVLAEEETEDYEFLQTEANYKYIDGFLSSFQDTLVLIQNRNDQANQMVPQLKTMVTDHWMNSMEDSAWNCYHTNKKETSKLLLKLSYLDLDQTSFLSTSNKNWLQQWTNEVKNIYQDKKSQNYGLYLQLSIRMTEDDTDGDEESDEDEEELSLADSILNALELVENCDGDANDDIEDIADQIEDDYDEDYEEAMQDMCESEPDKSADIFVILDSLDSDELTFLSTDNMAVLDDIFNGMRTYYEEIAEGYEEFIQVNKAKTSKTKRKESRIKILQ